MHILLTKKQEKRYIFKSKSTMNEEKNMLSICCITYNHEQYIEEAIRSFLNQVVNFSFNIVIVDDLSKDNTYNICESYAKVENNNIQLIRNENNLGPIPNLAKALNLCNGKYIAWCEGDDYWTDPYKLQKQVDFLERNPEFTLSFHNAIIKWDDHSKPDSYFCPLDQKPVSSIEDVIKGWFIPSASMVFRKEAIIPLPEWFPNVYNGDWALQMIAASKGKIGYINKPMSVYRKSSTALSGNIGKDIEFVNTKRIIILELINTYTAYKHMPEINSASKLLKDEIFWYRLKRDNYTI